MQKNQFNIPSIKEVHEFLEQGKELNPCPWIEHSIYTGKAAKNIAKCHPRLDPETAYVFGCLHDIGRRFGASHIKHVIDGYKFMNELGYPNIAKICLTHSFPIKHMNAYFGEKDCSKQDLDFLADFLSKAKYSEYDLLIQLCDALATSDGFCLIEKRLIDVVLRNGLAELTIPKWQKIFEIKQNIEKAIRSSIYKVLPGVQKNTFSCYLAA